MNQKEDGANWRARRTQHWTEIDISRVFEDFELTTKGRQNMKHSGAKHYKQGMNKQMKLMK